MCVCGGCRSGQMEFLRRRWLTTNRWDKGEGNDNEMSQNILELNIKHQTKTITIQFYSI